MNKQLQKCAEILVESGYLVNYSKTDNKFIHTMDMTIDPFADTLEGMHQLFAIWNWLNRNHQNLLIRCNVLPASLSEWDELDYIIRRAKWCIEELTK